jgi:hypothetical protein
MDPLTDSYEGTPLVQAALEEEDVYSRFSPARKKVILGIVSVTGVMPCMSVSTRTRFDNISSVCNRNIHSPHSSNCEGLEYNEGCCEVGSAAYPFMKLKSLLISAWPSAYLPFRPL